MATEEVMIDYDMQTPKKKKVKKVASMKNNAMYEAPNPFKNKAELMEYRKKVEKLYRPGYGEMGRKERPVSEMVEMLEKKSITPKSKSKTSVMKKDEKIKKSVLESAAPLAPMKMADEISDDKEWSKKYKANSEQQKDSYKGLRDAMLKQSAPMEKMISMPIMESKETPMDEKKSKLESLKKPATKKD
jgi:hypothetical protein